MRLYDVRRITAKHMRNGVDFLLCGDCGCLVFERAVHDAWHRIHDQLPLPDDAA